MFKVIAAVILMFAYTRGEIQNIEAFSSSCLSSIDQYIELNRQAYRKNIKDYDNQMDTFKKVYISNLESITLQRDLLLDSIKQENASLSTLESLNDLSKKCVAKYRSSIPTVYNTKVAIDNCVSTASGQLNNLLASPLNTRNYLDNYYKNTFESDIKECDRKFPLESQNHIKCVTNAVSLANSYTLNNQKTFATQMRAANSNAKTNIKNAIDCSFVIINRTLSSISVTDSMIDICIFGLDGCRPGMQAYSCPEVYYVQRSQVDSSLKTIANPFYGHNNQYDCLNIQVY